MFRKIFSVLQSTALQILTHISIPYFLNILCVQLQNIPSQISAKMIQIDKRCYCICRAYNNLPNGISAVIKKIADYLSEKNIIFEL